MTVVRPFRILALDDSPDDVKLMERHLRAGDLSFDLLRVEERAAFEAGLEAHPDVILLDYKLPQFDGLAALRLAKQRLPNTPVIVVTGSLSDALAVEFLQEGAADYILKDRSSRLAVAVRRAVAESVQKQAGLEAEAKYRALFTEARDGIALVDCGSGRVLECNAAFEHQAGRPAAQLAGLSLWELVPPAQSAAVKRAFQSGTADSGRCDVKADMSRPDGSTVRVEFSASVIVVPGKRYAQIVTRDAA